MLQNFKIETNLGTVIRYGTYVQYTEDVIIPQGYYLAAFGGWADTSYVYGLDLYVNASNYAGLKK